VKDKGTRPNCRRCGRPLAASYGTKDVRVEQESLAQLVDPSIGPDVYTKTVGASLSATAMERRGSFARSRVGTATP
jgi:hypothetical protein